ncbi:LacI family transcriptional regulator [Pararhizobium antarcticum]|uniref:LacI family transcriptional regulator n=1 Tax=Pararhizobium antarcticum TaxID=1798805 RepID=UPI001FD93E0C|nr:LacI family transcriptional regulator [Pararhizobium antarcticum]
MKTIAQVTGLAAATVSRALNDAADISASTKERVRLAARQVGYRPNRAGLRLRTGKTRVVALVLNIEDEILGIVSPLLSGVAEVLEASEYNLVVIPETPAGDPLKPVMDVINNGMADGIILTRTQPYDLRVKVLTDRDFPFVTYGRTDMKIKHPYIDFDNEAFAYESVRRLAALGRRNLALLAPPPHLMFHRHMSDGFRRGIRDFDCMEMPLGDIDLDTPLQEVFNRGRKHFLSTHRADGIVAGSASASVALLAGLEQAGATIQADFDMVAKEPARFTEWIRPEIIAINEDIRGSGIALARTVLSIAAGHPLQSLQQVLFPSD